MTETQELDQDFTGGWEKVSPHIEEQYLVTPCGVRVQRIGLALHDCRYEVQPLETLQFTREGLHYRNFPDILQQSFNMEKGPLSCCPSHLANPIREMQLNDSENKVLDPESGRSEFKFSFKNHL
ncbi:uncharacterized protein ACOB8E_013408 [Sarcophilus harrisii]